MTLRAGAFCLSVCLLCFASGCAYRFGDLAGGQLENIETLHVPVAVNDTYEPGLGPLVTDAVIQRLMRDGTVRIARKDTADAELLIRLRQVNRRPLRTTLADDRRTAEYELRVSADITCRRLADGKVTYQENNITGRTEYFVGQDLQEGERQALGLLVDDLAQQITFRLVEGWTNSSLAAD